MAFYMLFPPYEGLKIVLYEKSSDDKRTSIYGGEGIANKKTKSTS
jgi:hypothetical protein